jgi:hypothetical protein
LAVTLKLANLKSNSNNSLLPTTSVEHKVPQIWWTIPPLELLFRIIHHFILFQADLTIIVLSYGVIIIPSHTQSHTHTYIYIKYNCIYIYSYLFNIYLFIIYLQYISVCTCVSLCSCWILTWLIRS